MSDNENPNFNEHFSNELLFQENQEKIKAISRVQAIIEFDMQGTILTANENFLNLIEYKEEEIKGKHHSIFVEPSYANSREYRQFWDDLNKGKYIADEFKRFGNRGKEIWIQSSYNPIYDLNNKPYKVIKYNGLKNSDKK